MDDVLRRWHEWLITDPKAADARVNERMEELLKEAV